MPFNKKGFAHPSLLLFLFLLLAIPITAFLLTQKTSFTGDPTRSAKLTIVYQP